jgi:hypothetical protein
MRNFVRTTITALLSTALLAVPAMASASSTPAAHVIGVDAVSWSAANSKVGPLQEGHIYYGTLPSHYAGTYCSALPAGDWCIVSYNKQTTNVAGYVASIPASRHVVMNFDKEPEAPHAWRSGAAFVSAFDAQTAIIRKAAHGAKNVFIAMAAMTYQYGGKGYGHVGVGCSYIPPPSKTDFYYGDNYEATPTGKGLATDPKWLNWLNCVKRFGKPLGLAEYALGQCSSAKVRLATLVADAAYLRNKLPAIIGRRTQLWSYFWVDNKGIAPGSCRDWQFTNSAMISAWRGIEAGG